jgi:hypothetical protein
MADTLHVMDLHVCSHLDPMEPTRTRGVHGYSHLELVAIATSGDVLAAARGDARQCVPAGDKDGSDSPTAAATELEVVARGKNTMLTPKDSSGLAQLLVAVPRGEVTLR